MLLHRFTPAVTHLSAALVLLIGQASRISAQPTALRGRWHGELRYDSVTIEFPLSWSTAKGGALALALYNGADSITSTRVRRAGDSVVVDFAHLATQLRGVVRDGAFVGLYGNPRRRDTVLVVARPASKAAVASSWIPNIAGTWILPNESPKGEKSWRFVVGQRGAQTTATILRVDGDAGALTGTFVDGRFRLYHFDGTRPSRLDIVPQPDGSLALAQRGPRGAASTYVAYRADTARARGIAEPANFATHTRIRDPREPFRFAFPDVDGRIVSNTDAKFAGKVVLVNVTGSWCPNCHDEAPFLSSLYRKYRERGFEIVALDFEESEQLADLSRLKAFIAKYDITYNYLVAGEPREVLGKIPQAVNLNTWPATFFLARDGTVRAIRTGFAAKASGVFHDSLTAEYEAIVQALLKEPAPAVPPGATRLPGPAAPASEPVAHRVHRAATTIDAHIDVWQNFNAPSVDPGGGAVEQLDLPKLEAGDLDAAVVALFAESLPRTPENRIVARTLNTLALRPDIGELRRLYADGVRVFGFAHVGDNDFAHSSRPSAVFGDTIALRSGLTDLGLASVDVLNNLGVILDVSQLTPAGVFDVLRVSRAPIIASHSALRSRVDVPRNLSDAEATAIAERGGVIHIVAFGPYLKASSEYARDLEAEVWAPFGMVSGRDDPSVMLDSVGQRRYREAHRAFSQRSWKYWTLDDYLDTIEAAVKLVGIDHVGLSSDFNHGGGVHGYAHVGEAANVTVGLLNRGYSAADIGKLWGNNFLRVWRTVEKGAVRRRA